MEGLARDAWSLGTRLPLSAERGIAPYTLVHWNGTQTEDQQIILPGHQDHYYINMDQRKQPKDVCTTSSKVTTLTNWKRLANVPDNVNITGLVQAVHWCDYIVLLDDKNIVYLYHLKWGIWSSMNSMNLCTAASGCPLGVFRKDLIMVASGGNGIYMFSMDTGHWMRHESLNTNFGSGYRGTINHVVLATSSDRQSLFILFQTTKNNRRDLCLRRYQGSSWSKAE